MFNGDWNLALASYNGGPGRVQRAMRRSRLTDFWRLSARPGLLPRETRDYVPMVLAAMVIARNPTQYGFSFEETTPVAYESIALPQPVDLRRIAEWADTTVDEIQALNPELRRWTTPVRDAEYAVKVPLGTGDLISLKIAEASSAELASLRWHTVKSGETLTGIARNLRVNRSDLAEANFLRITARLMPGQQLIVPHEPAVLMAASATGSTLAGGVASGNLIVAPGAPVTADLVKITYRVKRGDTLFSIARQFQTSVASLRTWNGLAGSKILLNQSLTVYTPASN
jgi:membrane-bound lytic murein transglycosylase D